MRLVLILIGAYLFLISCSSSNYSNQSGGVIWQPVDSSLVDSVALISLGEARGAIFPASYDSFISFEPRFTPSEGLIREIEPYILNQYSGARRSFVERQVNDPMMYSPPLTSEEKSEHLDDHMRWIEKESKEIHHYDRQYLGYYNEKGDQILLIQFLDFSKDPHGFKPHLHETWVAGWHGWFETNVRNMYFNINEKRLTVNPP